MSLLADARATLDAYQPTDPRQHALRAEFLALAHERDDAVWRSAAPSHLTVGAMVADPARGRVVLVLHGKVHRWLQPGGHCEPGDESLATAALREAEEETGITGLTPRPGVLDLDRHPAPCRPGEVEHHLDVRFLLLAPSDATLVCSSESDEVRWFDWADLPSDVEPSIVRMVAAARARLLDR